MLKYTLGALGALAIAITAAFIILLQVSDGGADAGPARRAVVTILADGTVPPLVLTGSPGEVIDLQLENRSAVARSIRLTHDSVEQLPEALTGRPAQSGIYFAAAPTSIGSALVRFNKKGTYQLNIGFDDVIFPPATMDVVID